MRASKWISRRDSVGEEIQSEMRDESFMSTSKEELHRIIDELPEWALDDAASKIKRIEELTHDPVYQAFMTAPLDDEPLTPEEEAAIAEAYADIEAGRVYSWTKVRGDEISLEEVRERFRVRQSRSAGE